MWISFVQIFIRDESCVINKPGVAGTVGQVECLPITVDILNKDSSILVNLRGVYIKSAKI